MIRPAIVALCVVSAALAVTVALELRPGKSAKPLPAVAAATQTGRATLPVVGRQENWVATILARPLFSTSRRPPAVTQAAQPTAAAKLPRLAGIMVAGTGRSVIFAPEGDGKLVVVAEGGELNGFKVERIANDSVVVIGSGGRQVLRPRFDNALPPPPPPIPVAVTPVPGIRFNGPPGLDRMPPLVANGQGVATGLPGQPSLNNLTGIPGLQLLAPPAPH